MATNGKKINRNEKHKLYMSLFNTKEWWMLRARKIQECEGLCQRCIEEGKAEGRKQGNAELAENGWKRPAKIVHHILPVEGVPDEPEETLLERMKERCFDYNNLILLCWHCHHRTHEEMKSHYHQAVKTMPKDETESEHHQEMAAFAEKIGCKYEPIKKGMRKTRFGWLTKAEQKQREKEQFDKWKEKIDGLTNTQTAASMDAPSED